MSRRPTTTTAAGSRASGMSRIPSSASLAMPPPAAPTTSRGNRPPSAMSASTTSSVKGHDDGTESRSSSPSRRRKVVGTQGAASKTRTEGMGVNENGEINIQVIVRCRGRSQQEVAQASPVITSTSGAVSKSITVETTPLPSSSMATFTTASSYGGSHAPMTKTYPFDKVFGPEADQTMIFNEVADGMLDEVLAGYNCTIFAYGQTGTGKTYTMQGDLELTNLDKPKTTAGIVPRVLYRLFNLLESAQNTEYSVKCSYVELYNEELRDLLATEYKGESTQQNANSAGLKLYEDGKKGVYIQGLEETGVRNLKEALGMLGKGVQRRQTAETKMNTESSRSHTIFSITVHVKESGMQRGGEDLLKVGKFNLVDLAGSEAIGRSGATDKRAREAGMINQSLLTLGRVISALVEKGSHIPYRESKLTRLLQDSLGGRTKTCIVATVSPTRSNMEETLSTLDYAIRAKSIRNRPEINQHMTKTGLLKEYVGDIERLKVELMAAREKNGIYIPEEQWKEMHDEQVKLKSDYDEAKLRAGVIEVELETKKKEFDEVSERFLATAEELTQIREAERQLTELLDETKVVLEKIRVELEEETVVSQAYKKGEQRLHQVAGGLKKVATESVNDVGGLFDKLARKAKVLGSNTDAAMRFGSDLQGLSKDLRSGLGDLHTAQNQFGQDVKTEMERHAATGQETSEEDIIALDRSFAAFTELAKRMTGSVDKGQREASDASKALLVVKDEVQASVRDWAQGVSERSRKMVEDLLDHQQEHLNMVGSVLDSTADLVDAVITTTQIHLSSESAAAVKSRDLALTASTNEVSRLKAQNLLLARLLTEEKTKSARLRTELIGNLTNMIEGFTNAQDESWSNVVERVQNENVTSVEEMQKFDQEVRSTYEEQEVRRRDVRGEMEMGVETSKKQRNAGQNALGDVRDGMQERLESYGKDTSEEAEKHVQVVDGFCARFSKGASDVSSKATSRAKKQLDLLSALSTNVSQTHNASRARTESNQETITSLSSTLLNAQSVASSSFTTTYTSTESKLSSLMTTTERFLQEGIMEDIPTGITPKKKVWNVTGQWERTGPREAVLASWRKKRDMGQVVNEHYDDEEEGGEGEAEVGHLSGKEAEQDEVQRSREGTEDSPPNGTISNTHSGITSISRETTPIPIIPVSAPLPAVALNQSGLRPPTSLQLPLPRSKSQTIVGAGKKNINTIQEIENRPAMTVLGEGVGVNVPLPRRGRR